MKFMKLGSRPDTFYTAEAVRSVSSEVSSDIVVQVKGNRYLLHKFPLLSKCLRLQKLCSECPEASQLQTVLLPDFPGGIEAFEMCAKFCYGMTITLSACTVVSTRCAAEYLQMTEDAEKGNLIHKIQVFFTSCILPGWRDSILALQSTKALSKWSEDLDITGRCIEAIASKIWLNPSKVNLAKGCTRLDGSRNDRHKASSCKGWWAEDVAELEIDLYWRTMIAIKAGGKVPSSIIGDALRIYASRWLPNVSKYINLETDCDLCSNGDKMSKDRKLLESIISLLPAEKGAVSCGFLLKLLKAVNILKASSSTKMELARRAGLQLEEATVGDLLIPSLTSLTDMVYDVDIVMTVLDQFMLQGTSPPVSPRRVKKDFAKRMSRSAENVDLEFQESKRSSSASHSAKIKVAKLVDRYLREIAREKRLPLSTFIRIAEAIPEFSRLDHDDLYKAVDVYLKEHPELNKSERKCLCRILDCKKLSMEACFHAAQNEMLPLRVVVQVLFFEQARAAVAGGKMPEVPSDVKALLSARNISLKRNASFSTNAAIPVVDRWSSSVQKVPNSSVSTKLAEFDALDADTSNRMEKSSMLGSLSMVSSRPKSMFSKFRCSHRNASESN